MSGKNKIFEIAYGLNAVDKVYFINEVFGNEFGADTKDNLINQAKNLYDELDELQEAIDDNDSNEIIDAIGDLLTFVYGVSYFRGMNSIPVHSIVPSDDADGNQRFREKIKSDTDFFIAAVKYDGDVNSSLAQLISSIKGLCVCNGIDEETLMARITASNLTKICMTYEDMVETVDKYESLGVDVYAKYFKIRGVWGFVVYSSKEQTVKGKVYRKNKFLKCIHFEEPVLDDLSITTFV